MCTDEQHKEKLTMLHEIVRRLEKIEKKEALDSTPQISTSQPLVVDYKNRKHLFIWTANALTLTLDDLGQIALSANTWTNISYQEGMKLVPTNQASLVPVFLRATDETIP